MRQRSVRKVISGSGNRSDLRPDRGRLPCMVVGPLSRSATIKKGASRGTRTNVRRAHSAPTNPNDLRPIKKGTEARGLAHLASDTQPATDDSSTPTLTDVMSSSSSAQGTPS
jgi:hypothetical protein